MTRVWGWLAVMVGLMTLPSCQPAKVDYSRPLRPGQFALRKVTNPEQIPVLTLACADRVNLRHAIDNSLNYLAKPSSEGFYPCGPFSHEHAVKSLKAFREIITSTMDPWQMEEAIRDRFDFYMSVGCDDMGTVLFTGYYTPIFDGSMTKTARYRYPLYTMPEDLEKGPNGEILGRRGLDGKLRPYPPRSVLVGSGLLKGRELVWLDDPFEVYIAHVQGSAVIRLPDGERLTVGYAANNGHEYRSIGKGLIRDGKIEKDKLSLRSMIEYFKAHPEDVPRYTRENPRFVFFRTVTDGTIRGSLNEPVLPMRSIATDKSIFPRGMITLLDTRMPRQKAETIAMSPYVGFALDQDTGGAIRAPGRCDVYMGEGEEAGELAGHVYQEGRLFYLFLKQ